MLFDKLGAALSDVTVGRLVEKNRLSFRVNLFCQEKYSSIGNSRKKSSQSNEHQASFDSQGLMVSRRGRGVSSHVATVGSSVFVTDWLASVSSPPVVLYETVN